MVCSSLQSTGQVSSFDVQPDTSQPLLVTVSAGPDTKAGEHRVAVTLTDGSGAAQKVSLSVTVYNFTLPTAFSLPSIWGFNDELSSELWPATYKTQSFQQSYVDFFLERRFPIASLYGGVGGFQYTQTVAGLRSLWQRGQRVINVESAPDATSMTDAKFEQFMNTTKNGVDLALQAGWDRESVMVYMMDEPGTADVVQLLPNISAEVKKRFGNVTTVTCGDAQWSVRLGLHNVTQHSLPHVDVFIPRCWTLTNTSAEDVASIRASGQRIGCYTSGIPSGENALNFFVEYPAIRARLMLGVGAWHHALDFFLYYRLNGWEQVRAFSILCSHAQSSR